MTEKWCCATSASTRLEFTRAKPARRRRASRRSALNNLNIRPFYVLSDLWIYGIYVDISGLQVSGQKEMSVVDLPDSKPLITGANPRGYKVRKQSNIVCRYILQ